MATMIHEWYNRLSPAVLVMPVVSYSHGQQQSLLSLAGSCGVLSLVIATILVALGLEEGSLGWLPAWASWFLHVVIIFTLLLSGYRFVYQRSQHVLLSAVLSFAGCLPVIALVSLVVDHLMTSTPTSGLFNLDAGHFLSLWINETSSVSMTTATLWLIVVYLVLQPVYQQHLKQDVLTEAGVSPLVGWPDVLSAVPVHKRGQLLSISSDQHYLDVITTADKSFIRGSFHQVTQQLAVTGIQVHRSHWVAYAAIVSWPREDNQWYCELNNGLRLPVSRRRRRTVQSAWEHWSASQLS